jgi:hypothetical protein
MLRINLNVVGCDIAAAPMHTPSRWLLPSSVRQSLCALVMQSSAPAPRTLSPWDCAMGVIEDSISQCTFLQMIYTAENPHADGSDASGSHPRFSPPLCSYPHDTSPAPTATGCLEDRCPVVSKLPLHSHTASKMSLHTCMGQDPVLADHVPSPTASGSHCPTRALHESYGSSGLVVE